jgi:hypothetical protein
MPTHASSPTTALPSLSRKWCWWRGFDVRVSIVFDELLKAAEGGVPVCRDLVEVLARGEERLRLEFPQAFSAVLGAVREPGICEHVEMLGNGLTGDAPTGGQLSDRKRTLHTQTGDETKTRLVAQCGENRCGRWLLLDHRALMPRTGTARCCPSAASSHPRSHGTVRRAARAECCRSRTRSR